MDLFKVDSAYVNINYDITFTCLLNDDFYICSKDGHIYKYQIRRNKENSKVELKYEENYLIKGNKIINKIVINENESAIIILVDDFLYLVKNFNFQVLNLISKHVSSFYVNESNKSELLVVSKKKLYFYKYENETYKAFKEMYFSDNILSILWVKQSLFLTLNKKYYLLNLKNNEKVLLYSHEYSQTYKYITLINMNEIFIVCDLNIGVFYDINTSMPSKKNTITLSDNIKHIAAFHFFLCCLNSKGIINFYNINNQQHVQSIDLNDYLDIVINYSNMSNSLFSLFEFSSSKEKSNNSFIEENIEKKFKSGKLDDKDFEENKLDDLSMLSKTKTYNYLQNNIYLINNKSLKIIGCIELYKYLYMCIEQKQIEKGFLLIENYNFEKESDRVNILSEYNKACAYYYFKNLNFSLAFLHFEKTDINIFFLLFFWVNDFSIECKRRIQNEEKTQIEENINKHFNLFLPSLCTIEELIDHNYSSYINEKNDLFIEEAEKNSTLSNEKDEIKKKILYTANNCLIKYLLSKRGYIYENKENIAICLNNSKKQIDTSHKDNNYYLYIHDLIDNILLKLMIKNNYINYSNFIMKTKNLNINIDECVDFLQSRYKFIEIVLIYIRFEYYEKAIEMCYFILQYYNKKNEINEENFKNETSNETGNVNDYVKNTELENEKNDKYLFWIKFLEKQNFKSKIDKNNSLNAILKEIYNILIILNDNVHMINIGQSKIKKLFECSFPFLIKHNENLFFDFIINKNFLLRPDEILNIFKKLEKSKISNIKIKYYIQKYVISYLKYDKYNENINTALAESYINDTEKSLFYRKRKLLKILYSNYPIDTSYLIQIIKDPKLNLVKAILYGKIHRHYDSLAILSEENFLMCEKYCHYYNFLLKKIFKKISEEDYEKIFFGIYNNDKTVYYELLKKNREIELESSTHFFKKKNKKISGNFIKDIIKEYHKYSYVSMNKSIKTKMKKKKKGKKNSENEEEKEDEKEKKKNEFDYMLHLIKEQESNSSDDITNFNENYFIDNYSNDSFEEMNSDFSCNSVSDFSDNSNIPNFNISENITKKKKENEIKKQKKDSYEKLFGDKHKNREIDLLSYFKVYENSKNRSAGFFFLLVKVYIDKYNEPKLSDEKKQQYKKYILYILNKYSNHDDFDNIYIFKIIPEKWKISEISSFVNFNLKKKLNINMNLQVYHNLIKSHYLNISYDLIKKKEERILINDKIICNVCNTPIVEKSFAYFSEKLIIHIYCLEKYDEENYN
ncbi:conserved Plasmodium protein, unknown function [Plasmodium relictum]|uniref:CNH domain-containing protein n=1 Tax=Plasmodium relictum TaxID=85471 RepID=A0A1J1HD43_PLARL|nr:conserved Plasmodium protein, unknown function [Plasmodium relictum]CRH03905.1 conserved Plasmodium protein, unknown function [Plasmodium relictum]